MYNGCYASRAKMEAEVKELRAKLADVETSLEDIFYLWRTYNVLPETTDEQIDKKNDVLGELIEQIKEIHDKKHAPTPENGDVQ